MILARLAGCTKGLERGVESVKVQNIVPEDLRETPLNEFEKRLVEFDGEFEEMNAKARARGNVLRYVGVVERVKPESDEFSVAVEMREYPSGEKSQSSVGGAAADKKNEGMTMMAGLKGSDNVVRIVTEWFPQGLVIQGAGAGAKVTGFGMMSDTLALGRLML